jgi:lipoyl(octanoyl) transferase
MNLHVLPTRTGGAAENMAIDFLLLQRYPQPTTPRFRHYTWRRPAFTFGYAQKISFIRAQLPPDENFDLCRRPTGGGLVDHRDDWTYALVIPRGHPLEALRASQSYRVVHEALADALRQQNVPVVLKPVTESADEAAVPDADRGRESAAAARSSPGGICFQHAEIHDVVHGRSGEKIAGAAQKRNKHGLLFQGSIWKPATGPAPLDWDRFETDFIQRLATALGDDGTPVPWPELNEDEVSGLTEQYASPEWIEHR